MAKAFRPSVYVSVPHNYYGEFENNVSNGFILRQFSTYEEVKKRMKSLLSISDNNEVRVYRHKRGEWGEFFEHWRMVNGKPEIVNKGWM